MNGSKPELKNWYEIKEYSHRNIGYSLMFFILKTFPPFLMRLLAFPVGFGYYIFASKAKEYSRKYLENVSEFMSQTGGKKFKGHTFFHILSFATGLVENVQSWAGKFSFDNVSWQDDDVQSLVENINSSKGVVLIASHLGNTQMLRGLATENQAGTKKQMSITTITNMNVTAGFNELLKKINPGSSFNLINADKIGPETIFLLQDRLEKGEVIVIAGDRISANTDRNIELSFLGKKAAFPYGVFLLTALLDAPTYFIFGTRCKDISMKAQYDMFVTKNRISFDCGKKERQQRITELAENFARELEKHCIRHPYQWYNFYDFWK